MMQDADASSDRSSIAIAAVVNAAIGILYLWGLFLLPLEAATGFSRAALSLVPAIALVGFTVGVVMHDRLLRMIGRSGVAAACFLLAGGGHLLFALYPAYPALVIGYGVAFGLGSGIGYGLALSLASAVADGRRGLAIGIVMAAFALSGILLPLTIGSLITSMPPTRAFGYIGIAMLLFGALVFVLLRKYDGTAYVAAPAVASSETWRSRRLATLGAIFFSICFVGLMVVSHSTGIASANGLPARTLELMPTLFMLGYLAGSLLGGRVVEAIGGRNALIGTSILAAAGLVLLDFPSSLLALSGAAAVGLTFGASASLVPTLIGEQYGAEQIGPIYSKLIIAYGLAGLLAPWLTGLFFGATGGYGVPLILGIAMCAVSVLLGLTFKPRLSSGRP